MSSRLSITRDSLQITKASGTHASGVLTGGECLLNGVVRERHSGGVRTGAYLKSGESQFLHVWHHIVQLYIFALLCTAIEKLDSTVGDLLAQRNSIGDSN